MPEQNNIDKLFQYKLKSLKASPSTKTWAVIENKMAQKKRKVVPFWWFSGIAGFLILGFLIFPFYEKQDVIVPNNALENNFTSTEKEIILNNIDTVFNNHIEKENTQLVEKEKINTNEKKKEYFNNKQTKPLKQEKEMSVKKIAMKEKVFPENLAKNENQENENKTNHQQKEQTVASAVAPKQQSQKNAETNSSKNTIANKEINLLKKASESESNSEKKKQKNWSISTNFALLNSGSFSNTSPFSENLNNTTKGKNSVAYGVQIGFKINNKWSLRSGVHLQELNYQNNNVLVTASGSNIATVSFNGIPKANIQSVSNSSALADSFESTGLRYTNSVSGNLSQQFGYIEIPIELKYTLNHHNKLQTQLVGGFSSLFLRTNNVFLSNNFSNRSGDFPNLNNINFSSNLGVDFSYQFTKNWSFSINPMLKTFLNTFSDKANGFSPFNLGVYSGILYQF